MRIYEGMFVLDERRANENWDGVTSQIRNMLERNQAETLTAEKWDERRLAYPIKGRTRAVYYLVRFTAPPDAIAELERQCQLNDNVLRVLFTRDKHSEKLHKKGLLTLGAQEQQPAEPTGQAQEPSAEPPRGPAQEVAEGPGQQTAQEAAAPEAAQGEDGPAPTTGGEEPQPGEGPPPQRP